MPGHAQEFETAVALTAFPENVRLAAVADQPDPKPAAATAETGRELLERVVSRVATYLEDMIAGRRVAEMPTYFP
jgi:creatinine amidohydrolase/Fe(II)-dependent formamide hydrolase-like protein